MKMKKLTDVIIILLIIFIPYPEEWKKFISVDLTKTIMDRFQGYNKAFGYV